MKRIRILLIEDNRILAQGISNLVDSQNDMTMAGTAGSGENNIVQTARKAKPQIALIDPGVFDMSGAEIARLLKNAMPELKIIGLGLSKEGTEIADFVKAGATGFILKDAGATDVLDTIRWVAREAKVILPVVPQTIFTDPPVPHAEPIGDLNDAKAVPLTKREREIVRLIADSSSNKEIARHLNIAIFTVKSHVHNILVRLGLHSRLQIAKYVLMTQMDSASAALHAFPSLRKIDPGQRKPFVEKNRAPIPPGQKKYAAIM